MADLQPLEKLFRVLSINVNYLVEEANNYKVITNGIYMIYPAIDTFKVFFVLRANQGKFL